MRAALLFTAAVLLTGCEAGPTTGDLYGRWEATSDGITRAFHFDATIADDGRPELDGVTPAFIAYRYGAGGPPLAVESGRYAVREGTLVRWVLWDQTSTEGGAVREDVVDEWDGQSFRMVDETVGPLRYTRVDALPGAP